MNIRSKYNSLNEREQKLLLVSLPLLVVAGFYWLIWQPINNTIAKQTTQLAAKQDLLSFVKLNGAKYNSLNGSNSNSGSFVGSMTQAVNNSASTYNIEISRMQPQNEQLQLWIDNAKFNDLMAWLYNLEQKGIKILVADFAETDTTGYVKVRRLQLGK